MLVVDDEPLVRWSIAEILATRGYDISEAEDCAGAMRALADRAAPPDLVLLDLRLPDCDDLRLLAAARRLLPSAPVILMTAFGTPEVIAEARQLGACRVIDKPFDLERLPAILEEAVESVRVN